MDVTAKHGMAYRECGTRYGLKATDICSLYESRCVLVVVMGGPELQGFVIGLVRLKNHNPKDRECGSPTFDFYAICD
jgi:hypothetical protein